MLLDAGSELLGAAGGRLVLPGGVPGGQFCESCIFERSDSVAFTYHIRCVLAGTGSSRLDHGAMHGARVYTATKGD